VKLKFWHILFSERDFGVFDTLRSSIVLSQSMRAHNSGSVTTDP